MSLTKTSTTDDAIVAPDLASPRFQANPYPFYARLRDQAPVFPITVHVPQRRVAWLVTRYGWNDGVKCALLMCIALSLLTLGFQWLIMEPEAGKKDEPMIKMSFLEVVKSFSPALRELLVSDILIRFCERIPYTFVILWAIDHGGVTAQQFGYLVALEMMAMGLPVAETFSESIVSSVDSARVAEGDSRFMVERFAVTVSFATGRSLNDPGTSSSLT